MKARNPYLPYPVRIDDIVIENEARDLKTFRLVFEHDEDRTGFRYLPGQFGELSVFGVGESPFGIASAPSEEDYLLFTVKNTGSVTGELHNCEPGRTIGVRGPFGNGFPWELMAGKNILIVSGGFAFTTLRSALIYMQHPDNRKRFGRLTVVYGARDPGELLYKDLLAAWEADPGIDLHLTVDRAPQGVWEKHVGLVPNIVKELAPPAENGLALVCGPPIMIRYTVPVLQELGFADDEIILSLENRMKCGIGKCGRCNIGAKYVCIDGPVFSYAELSALPPEY